MPELSQELTNECAGLIYAQWAKAFDAYKAVRAEKDDGSEDWAAFHQARKLSSEKELARWKAALAEITPLHTIGK